jgi:hypothetical protein
MKYFEIKGENYMKRVSIAYPGLLLLFVTLTACDSNTGSGTTTTQAINPESSPPPSAVADVDHSGHTVDMSGMSQSEQMGGGMDHSQHMGGGGMGGMDHSQHMGGGMGGGGMGGMDHSQHMGGGMGGGGMHGGMGGGGMNHERHRQHMSGMGDMDHEEHRKHMQMMGGMDHSEHMDHSGHMHGETSSASDMAGLDHPQFSTQGLYTASVTSALDPIIINQMHSWTLHLENAAKEPIDNAVITVDGGMPAHNHGLPTSPEVTEALGNGDYLVEGLLFQMPGHWQVSFEISVDGQTDSVTFDFNLE